MITRGFGKNSAIITRGFARIWETILKGIRAIVKFTSRVFTIIRFEGDK